MTCHTERDGLPTETALDLVARKGVMPDERLPDRGTLLLQRNTPHRVTAGAAHPILTQGT